MVVAVEFGRGVAHQQPNHLCLGLKLYQRPLHGLVDRQRFAEDLALPGVDDGPIDAVLGRPETARCLANPVLVQKRLPDLEAAIHLAEHRVGRHPHIFEQDLAVIGGHVERPPVVGDGEPRGIGRHQERTDASGLTLVA